MTDKVIPVKVAVRCRPLIPKEISEGCQLCVAFTPNEPQIVLGRDKAFTYDFMFLPSTYQNEVYETSVRPLLESFYKGYNATVLAYGQTGSGKTFTMGGCYEASLSQDEEHMGVIPRVLQEFFQGIDERDGCDFKIGVSYLEIHKEDLHDLLCPPSKRENLAIREECSGGITIAGLTEVRVRDFKETMNCLTQGSAGRTTGATAMNSTSSRSHAIFSITVEMTKKDDPLESCKAKFHLVDLAGSERIKRTRAEGERLKEGININRGLLALGNVISALGDDNQKRNHIPYRDSKLTRLLQDSLGGNSHTLMIACVSPADSNMEETINTLRYADRARKIKNKPIVNRDPGQQEIMRLKALIQQMQIQLIQGGPGDLTVTVKQQPSPMTDTTEYKSMLERLKSLEEENSKLSKELQSSVEQNTVSLEKILRLEMSRDKLKRKLQEFKSQTGVDFELLSQSIDIESNPLMKEELEKLKRLADNMRCQSDEDNTDEELLDQEPEEDVGGDMLPSTPDSRAITTQHALKQAQMNRELQELNRLLAKKEELANQMTNNDEKMNAMKMMYELSMKDMEGEISELQKEKENLSQALLDAKMNTAANKVSEQRRKRLQELESHISQLKKKMSEQCKLAKLKEQTDKQVLKLNTDIQSMKHQRVKLMKQIKEDAESFRKWKQQKDKEVLQLQQKDRKRQCQMQKMQKVHENQQTVLKRKAEEAAAANKRLKDALAKQKAVMSDRNKQLEKCDNTSIGNRVRTWLSQELEVQVSMREAKYHLNNLLNDRKMLSSQLEDLKSQLESGPPSKRLAWMNEDGAKQEVSMEEDGVHAELNALTTEIDLRNIQISDLQQKIVDAEPESKRKSVWESLHTMMEAKCALKWLLEQIGYSALHAVGTMRSVKAVCGLLLVLWKQDADEVVYRLIAPTHTPECLTVSICTHREVTVSSRADNLIANSKLKEAHAGTDDVKETNLQMQDDLNQMRKKYEAEVTSLQREHETKVLFLLKKLNSASGDINKSADNDTRERLEFQEKTIEDLSELNDKFQQVTEENEALKKQLTRVMYQGKQLALMPSISDPASSPFLTPVIKATKPKKKSVAIRKNKELIAYDEFMDDWDEETDDGEYNNSDADSDWTPMYGNKNRKSKKVKQEKKTSKSSLNSTFSFDGQKRKSADDIPDDEVKPKGNRQSRKIFQSIDPTNNFPRSSDEFENSTSGRSSSSNRSSLANSDPKTTGTDRLKKRKLGSKRPSLFNPLP